MIFSIRWRIPDVFPEWSTFFFKALINTTDQQIYCDLVAGEEDNTFLKE